jgi:hypothetical protein
VHIGRYFSGIAAEAQHMSDAKLAHELDITRSFLIPQPNLVIYNLIEGVIERKVKVRHFESLKKLVIVRHRPKNNSIQSSFFTFICR